MKKVEFGFIEGRMTSTPSKKFLQYFPKNDWCIINIASDLSIIVLNPSIYKSSFKNFVKPVTYSVIKHGLIGMTKYYASILAEYNIICNAISPVGVFNNQKNL
jgi:NAD(P)-dependent dehydrogenase (short-subunit alcohol dehydrogenase family)